MLWVLPPQLIFFALSKLLPYYCLFGGYNVYIGTHTYAHVFCLSGRVSETALEMSWRQEVRLISISNYINSERNQARSYIYNGNLARVKHCRFLIRAFPLVSFHSHKLTNQFLSVSHSKFVSSCE